MSIFKHTSCAHLFKNVIIPEIVRNRQISTTCPLSNLHLKTRLRVVDNSTLGKQAMLAGRPPYVIHVYRHGKEHRDSKFGRLGDKVLVGIQGQMKKGFIVGWKMHQLKVEHGVPRMDSNNIVLLDDNGNPLGTRILAPIPGVLRGISGDFAKILAIATKFV